MAKSREWAARCAHEAKMWEHNSFVTLTFNDEYLPESGSVNLRDLQLFFKRLRKSQTGKKLRFFACGEYGDLNKRPHYHALIFNHLFKDQKLIKDENGKQFYNSDILQTLWPFGYSTIARVTYQTAAYVARYNLKKINGPVAAEYYTWPHPITGKLIRANPEFLTMSKKPGIGYTWFEQFKSDCYPSDFLIVDGKKHPVPRYYDKLLVKEAREAELERIKRGRKIEAGKHRADSIPDRLQVREEVAKANLARTTQRKL